MNDINSHDLMDVDEVAEAFGVKRSSLHVALSRPELYSSLAKRLPKPLRRVGNSYVWSRADVEAALAVKP